MTTEELAVTVNVFSYNYDKVTYADLSYSFRDYKRGRPFTYNIVTKYQKTGEPELIFSDKIVCDTTDNMYRKYNNICAAHFDRNCKKNKKITGQYYQNVYSYLNEETKKIDIIFITPVSGGKVFSFYNYKTLNRDERYFYIKDKSIEGVETKPTDLFASYTTTFSTIKRKEHKGIKKLKKNIQDLSDDQAIQAILDYANNWTPTPTTNPPF